MATPSSKIVSEEQHGFLSRGWHDRLSRLIARHRKAAASAFLEQTIERSLPLFRTDRAVFESRRTAWLIRTQLLLEWNRPAEALAWTCLECQLSDASKDAKALRDRLLRQLNLDFEPAEGVPNSIAAESQWPGVAGMYELKAKLERDVILGLPIPKRHVDMAYLFQMESCSMARLDAERLSLHVRLQRRSGSASSRSSPEIWQAFMSTAPKA